MSIETSYYTSQEKLLVQLNSARYMEAVGYLASNLLHGKSPSNKEPYFDSLIKTAANGDLLSTVALPKFVMSVGHMATLAAVVMDNKEAILDQAPHGTLQYLSTFNPQHIGHRIAVQSALKVVGGSSRVAVHVMGSHPRKSDLTFYNTRFAESEQRLYKSDIVDSLRVTQIDLPGGTELANLYPGQAGLLAEVCGDDKIRWLIGSDKIMLDVDMIKEGRAEKAQKRLSNQKTHAYVIRRKSDQNKNTELGEALDFIYDKFGTQITLVDELPYNCESASSSRVKELRVLGCDAEADYMEFYTDLEKK